ncbi:amino acid adenylation domain-containing protein, partial [Fulvivirga kasyanovii]|uniref:non-ribosomal peptide synthetase n=1 Tax=Fulvivirga kasyanovii TaxID=396812 RepID=UPI0031CDDA1B
MIRPGSSNKTLISSLLHLKEHGDRGLTFIESSSEDNFLSYKDFYTRALYSLFNLRQQGVKEGDEVIIQIDDNQSFLITFWACLLGKIIPVPLSTGSQDDHRLKLIKVWKVLENPYLVSDGLNLKRLYNYAQANGHEQELAEIEKGKVLVEDVLDQREKAQPTEHIHPGDIAYIQFSSGSTGEPKGVTLTHANLVTNVSDIISRSEITRTDSMLSWMPLTHDMGLICFHFTGILAAIDQFIIPTSLFIRRPVLWIERAHLHKATLLYSPNFGYQYFLSSFSKSGDALNWDLSSVRLIYNGAELISVDLCEKFLEALQGYGLKDTVFFPGYGLAEASVAVTLPVVGSELRSFNVKRELLNVGDQVSYMDSKDERSISFTEVGLPIEHCQVRICDNDDNMLSNGFVGHIQIKGGNVTAGYYQNEEKTEEVITADGWLKTGDLGFLREGRLVVTGRAKNIIIINGQNYYPQDIELAAGKVRGVGLGKVVACSTKRDGAEEVVLFILFKGKMHDFASLTREVRESVISQTGIGINIFVPVRKIPKTTSGKIQNFKLLKDFQLGLFDKELQELEKLMHEEKPEGFDDLPVTQQLLTVWGRVFGSSNMDKNGNFLALGMNSLQATRFINEVHKLTQLDISVSDLFDHPTLEKLGNFLESKGKKVTSIIQPLPPQPEYDVSAAQRKFWRLSQYQEQHGVLNLFNIAWIEGSLNIEALNRAFEALVNRHESLRTRFVVRQGLLKQEIVEWDELGFQLTCHDLTDKDDAENMAMVQARQEATRPFVIEKEPLIRVELYQVSPEKWLFAFVINHIISDGWSVKVIIEEIRELYHAYSTGHEVALHPLHFQHKDFIAWKKQNLDNGSYSEHINYWKNELSGDIQDIDLPFRKPRPAAPNFNAGAIRLAFSEQLTARIHEFSRKQEGTLFMTLVAMLNVLLYRYTGQKDLILGTDATGRTRNDLLGQVGYYLNELALRSQVDEGMSFEDFLQKVKTKALEALKYQDVSVDDLTEILQKAPGEYRPSWFNVLVLLQNFEESLDFTQMLGGVKISRCEVEAETCFTDLQFEFSEINNALNLKLSYNTDLYDQEPLERLLTHFESLVISILDEPSREIGHFEMLSDAERNHFLREVNNTFKDYSAYGSNIIAYFQKQVTNHSEKVALKVGDQSFTYKELNAKANRLAHYLVNNHSVRENSRVGMLVGRSEWLIASMLGILKSGAAYVPLDPEYPAERIAFMAEDAALDLIVTDQVWERPVGKAEKVLLREVDFSTVPDTNPNVEILPDNLAYIIYTSGSTGRPKGVMIEHRSLADYVHTFKDYFTLSEEDIVVQQSSISFDTVIEEVFPILCVSGKLVLSEAGGRDVESLIQVIKRENVSVVSATPLVINELNNHEERLESLRVVISGGDELKGAYIDGLIKYTSVYNTYGPTESTVCALYNEIQTLEEAAQIGKPIANREVYILDSSLKPVPTGVDGEIYLGGAGLARGYVGLPVETRAKFIENPFGAGRLYKTGDVGRWLENGKVAFIGRQDSQVKVRGYRIELAEIEKVLLDYADVDAAVVLSVRNQHAQTSLAAYVTGIDKEKVPHLRAYLSEYLPYYMVPAEFVVLSVLPRTVAGKIDRKALPAVFTEQTRRTYTPPESPDEKQLVSIWETVLEQQPISINDHFFEIGGNSLSATKILTRVNEHFGAKISLRAFFLQPTVKELAQMLADQAGQQYATIDPVPEADDYDVSFAQKRLWLLNEFEGTGQTAYNLSWTYKFSGKATRTAIENAVHTLLQRHESLRTTFLMKEGTLRQRIHQPQHFKNEYIQYRNVSEEPGDSIEKLIRQEVDTAFDLTRGPLLRVKILQVSDQSYLMVFTMHHIISDGWSMEVILKELVSLIEAYKVGKTHTLKPLRTQYKDFVHWQQKQLETEQIAESRSYWINQLSDPLPVLDLPAYRPRPAVQTSNGDIFTTTLSKELTDRIHDLSVAEGATVFMTLLSVMKLLFYRYTSQTDMIIGSPVAGRDHVELENQVGYYLNALALRTRLDGQFTFKELLNEVKHTVLEAYEHQAYPIDRLIDELGLKRDLSRAPLFETMLVFQNFGGEALRKNSDKSVFDWAEVKENHSYTSINDLLLEFNEFDDHLSFKIRYNTDLFTAGQIEEMAGHFINICSQVVHDPEAGISTINLLSDTEKELLIHGFNPPFAGSISGETDDTLHGMFELQADQHPDKIAIQFEDRQVTYRELNERSNQVAHLLRDRFAIKINDHVGLMTDRSEEMIIFVLGILKAGAAFVPIDPEYPEQRINTLVNDSDMKLLLSDQKAFHGAICETQYIDELKAMAGVYPVNNLVNLSTPENLAYIIYTSGSSGTPKGVMVEHGNVISLSASLKEAYNLDTFEVSLLQMASISFDVFVGDICRALLYGGRMVICPSDVRLDPVSLYQLIHAHKINIFESTPAIVVPLMNYVWENNLDVSFMKILIMGSDTCHMADYKRLLQRFGTHTRVINSYGTTETTIDASFYEEKYENLPDTNITPIGKPLNNTQLYILDSHGQLAPVGVPGEICIGGAGVSRGYLNKPELTQERFKANPYGSGRLYHTGDTGRWRPDGSIEYTGRKDHQVKIRGYRIELGEIEHALQSIDNIKESVVTVYTDSTGDKSLVAYIVSDHKEAGYYKEVLSQQLPRYMVPGQFMFLDRLPLTGNGKVDRKSLPSPVWEAAADQYVAPATATEEQLSSIWSDILGHEKIGTKDNF